MPYFANIYRVLIASPSDVARERDAAHEVILEWNIAHANGAGIFAQPYRWELNTAPEMGDRPQGIINKQLVDRCDILIGIFWTRLGTPTGGCRSGTEEEISRFMTDHKRVMLYFSEAPQPSNIDRRQQRKVLNYKQECQERGLCESYRDIAEFKTKLRNNLSLVLEDLVHHSLRLEDRGVRNFLSSWAGRVDDEFLLEQKHLSIFLKDGFTFFTTNDKTLRKRLTHSRQTTSILILHPDYEHMEAVADMDPFKRGRPEAQRSDCLKAIRAMHRIRAELEREGVRDIHRRIVFLGYRHVPTWNGFVGATEAVIHLYPTMPYRGDLQTLRIDAKDKDGKVAEWYQRYRGEFDEIVRMTQAEHSDGNMWNYRLSPEG